jgi:ketosteroid isomerase-like protein
MDPRQHDDEPHEERHRLPTATATATVQRMFAVFGAGTLDALLETVHPDSRWTYYGANPRRAAAEVSGHAAVRRFEATLARLTIQNRAADVRTAARATPRHGA